jgi:aminoglycoside phosphotransferase family enzyme/predicted kinase
VELARLIAHLSDSAAYPRAGHAEVEVIQTHASAVFLVGDDVYKVKKPVDFGFLDYSTLDKRRTFCEAEVRLNRRLAPSVYLGVVPIVEEAGGLRVDAAGTPVEWAVHMRRLPEEATLRAWLARGALNVEQVRALAARIARFHADAARGPEIAPFGRFEVVAGNCRENFEQIEPRVGESVSAQVFARLRDATERELADRRGLIEARAARGMPCDTHGDLRTDHVYLFPEREPPEDLCIVDCIEFNERFRYADPVTDIAFLVMDLHAHGAWALARELVEAYFDAADDDEGRALMPLYLAYRATVRGKVDAMRAAEAEVPAREREKALQSARGHLLLALRELSPRAQRPAVVLVGGLPGTGKSVLSRELSARGFSWVRSDVVRKELAGLAPTESGTAAFGTGIYTREWSDRTYAECLARTEAALFRGERVVVDATFITKERRAPFWEAARRWCVPVELLLCDAPPELVKARLDARTGDPSDADWNIHQRARERFEAPGADEGPSTQINASGTPASMIAQAERALAEAHVL